MKVLSLITVIVFLAVIKCYSRSDSDLLLVPNNFQSKGSVGLFYNSANFNQDTHTPDSTYKNRLSALPFEFKMSYNSIVKRYMELYAIKSKRKLQKIIGLGDFYFPIMDQVFGAFQVPNELKYIAIIESSLNPRAVSPANASGLWQFMRSTGKSYGLTINSYVDERRGIIESTQAVAKYLNRLYHIYHDWQLVLAAYNCGSGRVNSAIHRAGGKSDFWKIYKYLPGETRNIVPAFIGMAYALNYYKEHGIVPVPSAFPLKMDTVKITQKLYFQQVSEVLQIDMDVLRMINPQFLKEVIPANENRAYYLNIPLEHKMKFMQWKDSIYAHKCTLTVNETAGQNKRSYVSGLQRPKKVIHRVLPGENLWLIAKRYKVTVSNIKEWNNISGSRLTPGRKLILHLR
jgi:membrane-bound lytic murein transglycosylase D